MDAPASGGPSDRPAGWVRSPGSLPGAGNKPPASAAPPAPATPQVKPQPDSAQDPGGTRGPRQGGTRCCLVGELAVHTRRIRAPQISPPFAGATSGRGKQPPSTAGPAQGMPSQVPSGACSHQQDAAHGEPRAGPFPARHWALPGPRSREHPGRPAATPQHRQNTGTRDLADLY